MLSYYQHVENQRPSDYYTNSDTDSPQMLSSLNKNTCDHFRRIYITKRKTKAVFPFALSSNGHFQYRHRHWHIVAKKIGLFLGITVLSFQYCNCPSSFGKDSWQRRQNRSGILYRRCWVVSILQLNLCNCNYNSKELLFYGSKLRRISVGSSEGNHKFITFQRGISLSIFHFFAMLCI